MGTKIERENMKKKVLLGMSGGVDSSVSAIILQEQGYEVIGVTLNLFSCASCCSYIDVKSICNTLGIPHFIIEGKDVFQKYVINDFINCYKKCTTPNPCIECNKYMKFGLMYEKAKELGCDYIATGHYAKTEYCEKYNQYVLKKCKYNDIWYYCIEIPYRDNRIDSYYFRGVIRSTIAGGLSTITLPYRIKYKTKANGNNAEVINNSEINSSLSTTLTQGGITYVSSIEDTYYQNIKPHLSNSIFLGTTDLRWKCVYSYNLDISSTSTFGGEATFNGGMYSGNIFPLSNNNYRIGSSSNRFIDAYIQTWVYANSGLYMNPSGITQNGSYLELSSGGNEIIIAGGTDFYVNYRGASYGGRSVPKKWYWRTGSGSSWANMEFGDCTLHGWINSTGISASGANSFNVGARFSNTSNDSIEIVGGNYTMGLGCHSNGSWFWWRGTANPTISTNKSYVMAYDGSTWAFTGSITATAAITAKATSDFRLKENYDGLIDYRERLLKLGRVYDYNYNKKALDLYQDRIDNKRHTGLVYQNAVKAGITNFCHEKDEYGYGSLNYLSPDLIATIIGSVQANILSIRLVESEQERMRKELEHAKSEINRLKGLVASLQN